MLGSTVLGGLDLSEVRGLENVRHAGPSFISTDTLVRSKGHISEIFLRGCGLAPWEVLTAKLHDPNLNPYEISELQCQILDKRTHGPLFIGGVFISYSRTDGNFVDKLYKRLTSEGTSVWLDKHDMVAGPVQKQVQRAVRVNDVVVVILSAASINSDWVENELDMARQKEKEEKRDVLCPIALDDSWRSKMEPQESNRTLWLTLKQKNVLDFSEWTTEAFVPVYQKLVRGLKIYYPPANESAPISAADPR